MSESNLENILAKQEWNQEKIISLLSIKDPKELEALYKTAYQVKQDTIGTQVYFRGLIEFSNICAKNCYYCGIRAENTDVKPYDMDEESIVEAAKFAYENDYGSLVLQSGERQDKPFIEKVVRVLEKIKSATGGKLGITLCVGEQSAEVYRRFFEAGAHRYLLRIESSHPELYAKLHPADHSFDERIAALKRIQDVGFQTGTGVMIGLPFQTLEHLANDLLFFKNFDIDMVGMGPYIEHEATPLFKHRELLMPPKERFELSLKMIAILRLMMPDINIAATTALQTLDPIGREKGLMAGANVVMPNITPTDYRKNYLLYEDKPCLEDSAGDCKFCLQNRIQSVGEEIAFGQWGDSKHFFNRKNS